MIERELRAYALSFPLWWVLRTTDQLIGQSNDAVSQRDVSLATELDKSTVSYLMGVLAERGLVDRAPDFGYRSYRIWMTSLGEQLLRRADSAVAGRFAQSSSSSAAESG